jgi:carbon-monoxide dehydrogenase large subunit
MKTQGIGARVPRKEDARFLHGRGNYVSDMILADQQEVAFLRSPVAHGRIARIGKPQGREQAVFTWADLEGVKPIVASSSLPGYRLSSQYPLAHEKVRFVGDPIAMVVAASRAEAEDIAEQIDLEIEDLPPLADAHKARAETAVRVHEEWPDNLYLTMNYESGFDAKAQGAPVVVKRELALARQAMVPMEGKAVLALWDERADQLIVYSSTQTPHMVRIGLAETLGIEDGRLRVISPDVGGAFGYKCILQDRKSVV